MKNTKSRLIIIDISSFIFRAFYAIRPLHAPDGTPVNAVHGVLSMLMRLFADHRPTHLFIARDSKGPSFRKEMYPEYKANRSAPPEELIPQFPLIEQLVKEFKFKELAESGVEADDIIASVVSQWYDNFDEILIATSDKDLMQFVDQKVKIIDTMKDKIMDRAAVIEKMGVPPEQVVDYLALIGDTSDNVPGVKGIGPKGAQNLLEQFKTLEACLENAESVANKRAKEALLQHKKEAILSKKLIELKKDVVLHSNAHDVEFYFRPNESLIQFLRKLGMNKAIDKLMEIREGDHHAEKNGDVNHTQVEVAQKSFNFELISQLRSSDDFSLALLFLEEDKISLTLSHQQHIVFTDTLDKLKDVLINLNQRLVTYDAKKMIKYCLRNDIKIPEEILDIQLLHYIRNPDLAHGLDYIIESLDQSGAAIFYRGSYYHRTHALHQLADLLIEQLQKEGLLEVYTNIERPVQQILAKMELAGVSLNTGYLKEIEVQYQIMLQEIAQKISEYSAGVTVNLNSPKQVGELLFEMLKLPVVKKTKTGYSTDAEVLQTLVEQTAHPVPGLILKNRELEKLQNTYIKVLPTLVNAHTKKLHTHLNQTVAATGRLSSDEPNLQNIPVRTEYGRLIRKAFIATPGNILFSADYSQVELRLLAHFSKDPIMVKAFQNDEDIHAQTAAQVFDIPLIQVTKEQRSFAKAVNFGLMYGQSSFGLAAQLGIGRNEARDFITKYFNRFGQVKAFLDELKDRCEKTGYSITITGRKRYLPDIHSTNRTVKSMAERVAVNSPIQGSAADLVKLAMIHIDDEMKKQQMQSKMILQVHDELIFDVVEEELEVLRSMVPKKMESVFTLSVPLKVDTGLGVNWYDLK